jgi:two-component system chemotaxis response regulator CheB
MDKQQPIVVMGASSGGLEALIRLLGLLPTPYAVPTVIVLHQRPDRASGVPAMLARYTHLKVQEPEDKQLIECGHLYIAPPNYHLLIEQDYTFSLSLDAPLNYSRPSIDMLFESAADACGRQLVACVFSGANQDGANGAAAIKRQGGRVYIQAADEAAVAIMPLAVAAATPIDGALTTAAMASMLNALGDGATT